MRFSFVAVVAALGVQVRADDATNVAADAAPKLTALTLARNIGALANISTQLILPTQSLTAGNAGSLVLGQGPWSVCYTALTIVLGSPLSVS